MQDKPEWMEQYKDRIGTASQAIAMIRPGDDVFIGSACGQPQHLVEALVATLVPYSRRASDAVVDHGLGALISSPNTAISSN